jgi:hypothetical protein
VADLFDRLDNHLNHRLDPKTFAKEVFAHLTDKVIPQGADELANALFNRSAYLPWPGTSGPAPIETPPVEPTEPEPNNFDAHAALYGVSYTDQLNDAAGRGGEDQDRGMSR